MGILRTIFALTVVVYHSDWSVVFVGPDHAIHLFYLISGFLISYILHNTKSYKNPITFYSNRILRLYPLYYFVAALSLCAYLLVGQTFVEVRWTPVSRQKMRFFKVEKYTSTLGY